MIYIHKSSDGQFYFTVNGDNGQVVVTSETYPSKGNCKRGVNDLLAIFGLTGNIQIIDKS